MISVSHILENVMQSLIFVWHHLLGEIFKDVHNTSMWHLWYEIQQPEYVNLHNKGKIWQEECSLRNTENEYNYFI